MRLLEMGSESAIYLSSPLDVLEYKVGAGRESRSRRLKEAKKAPGGYKVLMRSGGPRGKRTSHTDSTPLGKGRTVADVRHLSEARSFIRDSASNSPEGTQFYIRYSKPSLRGERGYQEPNTEGYVVYQGEPVLVWTKSRDKRYMHQALQEHSDKASYIDRYLEAHHAEPE